MSPIRRHILVLSTGQHVGKTTTCLGLVHALKQRLSAQDKHVAYCKPVGQQHVNVGNGLRVDKVAAHIMNRSILTTIGRFSV